MCLDWLVGYVSNMYSWFVSSADGARLIWRHGDMVGQAISGQQQSIDHFRPVGHLTDRFPQHSACDWSIGGNAS